MLTWYGGWVRKPVGLPKQVQLMLTNWSCEASQEWRRLRLRFDRMWLKFRQLVR